MAAAVRIQEAGNSGLKQGIFLFGAFSAIPSNIPND